MVHKQLVYLLHIIIKLGDTFFHLIHFFPQLFSQGIRHKGHLLPRTKSLELYRCTSPSTRVQGEQGQLRMDWQAPTLIQSNTNKISVPHPLIHEILIGYIYIFILMMYPMSPLKQVRKCTFKLEGPGWIAITLQKFMTIVMCEIVVGFRLFKSMNVFLLVTRQ